MVLFGHLGQIPPNHSQRIDMILPELVLPHKLINPMLTISGVSKSFGARTLFKDVSLQINYADRIGLVGPNGAGKSTFLSLILRESSPDEGEILFEKGISTGYLPQESAPAGDETVLELATNISAEFAELRRVMKEQEAKGETESDIYHDAHAKFAELGGYQLEPKAKRILSGLSFRETDFNRPAREMSGGWVMRAHLARLLVHEPDLLLLDEPTNHLDLESLLWFQNYLQGYPGAIFMISHDREFLNRLSQTIIDIKHGQLHCYRGNYEDYLIQCAAREEQHLAAYKNQQKEIQSLQAFADRFRAKASKASQAQSKLKQIERMEKIEAPTRDDKKIKFRFPQPPRSGLRVITLENIEQAYGKNVVYKGLNFEAERDQRLVLVGPNGAGKSTLLKILAGVVEFQQGKRDLGHNTKLGYYSQYRIDVLNPDHTVFEEALDTPQDISEQTVRTVLGSFLFRGDDVFKKVSVLSGGEKSRLALVKFLLDPPNLLLMDEPTTHLDMASIDALIGALNQFEGTLIFISHDVYFIRAIAKSVLHINAGKITPYAGDYQYYLDKTKAISERSALTAGEFSSEKNSSNSIKPKINSKEQRRAEAEERQARSREKKEFQQKLTELETEISRLENRQKELTAQLEDPNTYSSGNFAQLNRELIGLTESLASLNQKWESHTNRTTP
jgi:ATP-binding cassette subfamily F protein 3